ncbi:hypothetical protein PHYBLDRAFT_65941 [Phycomyces blakesleeanus NRRL 1555(-)]|uniref:SWIM-type domain-containing protein n=1 Tax=Phycomyces blakesleeanus (strain ATCC 8743b / DSM 1359 / FGSC 10004 / NBRC 33097 / NRRL 1555) TaxID=763407 RepID=A0A162U8Y4_PHYB8|nr:hypothetical protein PHYBLDRAFT_65941 [Phycomyces blakesleeanus NRRL 1555(-)]OAD73333.1 hypothetical protein PHYBLDRAFT_65941 [Phycomyces blakesleeanus NRRL 1555(-)]|eukprot:XP_018291373.1 hypothetical protein PHYBLDRAFT_65941 [Phycomyces blakesleeanus NRRL 1555(-)]
MQLAIAKMQEYALANNFALVIKDGKPTRVYLKCSKGGHYKNTRKIDDNDRKKIPSSGMIGCPYLLKVSYKKAAKGYFLLKATHEIEAFHNHPLDDECMESILKGRLSRVTTEDSIMITKLIETNTKTREIQKAINDEAYPGHKLYVSKRALLVLDQELRLPEDDEKCYCMNKVQYGLPCHHTQPVERDLQISDLPDRWIIDARKEDKAWNQPNMQVPVIEKPKEWMSEIIKLEALFRSCEGSQQVADLLKKVKKAVNDFDGKNGHSPIKLQAPENVKYPGRRKGSSRPKYLPKDFGRPMWRKTSILAGTVTKMVEKSLSGLKVTRKQNKNIKKIKKEPLDSAFLVNATKNKTKQIEKEPLDPVDATKNKTKQVKQEPLDLVDAPQKNGFKRPATALEDYQYDNRTSVGKRVKFQPGFPVSHEIIDDVKGGFSPTADGWCGFRVLAHLIYKDQNKFPLVKRDMLAALPKYKTLYANTFGTDTSQLEKIIQHGSQLDYSNTSNTNTNTNTNTNFIPVCSDASMWFNTPDCAQLAADTYTRPVCVYSDSPNTPSTTFLSFALPNNKTKQRQPLIFNHVNSNHWTTVDLSRNISRKWPTVPELFFLGCSRNKIDDNFDTYWNKFKEFNKHDRRNAMLSLHSDLDQPIDLTPK